jgi:hypothetical protein
MAKSFKIPGLGLEIMRNNLKHSNDPYSYEVTNRLLEPKEEGLVQSIIRRNYPGQGWRIPDERELRIIAGLAELGVDLGLVSIDHPAYRETIASSTPVGGKVQPEAKLTIYCVKVDPKTHGGNGAKCYFDSSDYSTPTKIRLVRSI